MPINTRELMSLLAELSEENGLKVAVVGSLKGSLVAGACAFMGGLAFGPIGLALGGAVGGSAAAWSSQGTFRPVALVILEDMTPVQQALLASRVTAILRDFDISDLIYLTPLLRSDAGLANLLVGAVKTFIQSDMHHTLK